MTLEHVTRLAKHFHVSRLSCFVLFLTGSGDLSEFLKNGGFVRM